MITMTQVHTEVVVLFTEKLIIKKFYINLIDTEVFLCFIQMLRIMSSL